MKTFVDQLLLRPNKIKMTRGHNIVADAWAGASNPHPHPNPQPHTQTSTKKVSTDQWTDKASYRVTCPPLEITSRPRPAFLSRNTNDWISATNSPHSKHFCGRTWICTWNKLNTATHFWTCISRTVNVLVAFLLEDSGLFPEFISVYVFQSISLHNAPRFDETCHWALQIR